MKKSLLNILFIASLILGMASCSHPLEPDDSFIASNDIQLIVKGSVLSTYDPATWQLGYNPSENEFRICDDQMKSWCYVTCSEQPKSVGQTLEAKLEWCSHGVLGDAKGKFEVKKIEGDTYWLWCGAQNKQIAVTVCILK